MRKVLVAILCLFFLGACSRENEKGQPEVTGSRLELGVRSVDSMIITGMPASVYKLTGLPAGVHFEVKYFAAGEKIVYQDLQPGEHTFFVLGNGREDDGSHFSIRDREQNVFEFGWWSGRRLPELLGGVIKADGASEMMFVEMNRLVGGLKVNVVNQSEFNNIRVRLDASCYDSEQILLGDYTFIPLMSHSWEEFEVGEDIYLFPSKGAVFGEVVVYDEYWNEYCFDFEAKNSIQRNKKLELNLTLTKAAPHGRSIDVVNSVICEEKVLEL